jgi:hypothetical protein
MSEVEAQNGRNISSWKNEASQVAMTAASQAEDVTAKTLQSTGVAMSRGAEQQREFMSKAADQFGEAGRTFAQDSAEKMHTLMTFAGMAQSSAQDLQGCFNGLVEGVIRTNLRLAQEIFLVDSPRAFVDLQQRFMRDYFAAFEQGVSTLIRATSNELARPVEQ